MDNRTPTFTSDWFTSRIPQWNEHVVSRLAHRPDVHWLEVGSHEGRSALWALDNFLDGAGSTIDCIDVWERNDVETRFDDNVRGRSGLYKRKGSSRLVLPSIFHTLYHGAYIDGSHEEADVLADAELVLPLLRPGALLVFDDYDTRRWFDFACPERAVLPGVRRAVDAFLARRPGQFRVLHQGWQLFLVRNHD